MSHLYTFSRKVHLFETTQHPNQKCKTLFYLINCISKSVCRMFHTLFHTEFVKVYFSYVVNVFENYFIYITFLSSYCFLRSFTGTSGSCGKSSGLLLLSQILKRDILTHFWGHFRKHWKERIFFSYLENYPNDGYCNTDS